jgi:WD40 repeat protein
LDSQNPWPGLAAYEESARDFFHGRQEESADLFRLIRVAPLTVVYSKSGLGKSSLLQAGLFPLLRAEHYLPVYLRLDFSNAQRGSPLEHVWVRLKAELDATNAEYSARQHDEGLWEYLHRKDLELWSSDNFPLVPVFVFDQFEELFSRSEGNVELIEHVFDGLADLIENRIPPEIASDAALSKRARLDLFSQHYRLILSFREDFLPSVKTWEPKVPSLLRNYLRLEPMSRQNAINALELAGKEVLQQGVAASIVDFVANQDQTVSLTLAAEATVEPVLLSLCCAQLNRRRVGGAKIDQVLVNIAGQDILEAFYREALADGEVVGPPEAATFIEEYLIHGDHFRGDFPRNEALSSKLLSKRQLAALTDKHRLLRTVQHRDTVRVELIHDRMVPVVRRARDARKNHERQEALERQAAEDRKRAEIRERAARRSRRQAIFALAGAIFGIFCAVVAAVNWREAVKHRLVAVEQSKTAGEQSTRAQNQARVASFRALARSAVNQSELDPELGTVLALRAAQSAGSLPKEFQAGALREAGDTLGQTIKALRLRSSQSLGGEISAATLSPDHTRLVVRVNETLRTMTWPTGDVSNSGSGWNGQYWAPVFSRKRDRLAAIAPSNVISVWNTTTGQVEMTMKPPGTASVLTFSADGSLLAVGGVPTAWVWRVGTKTPFLSLAGHIVGKIRFSVTAMAFSPNGKLLATAAGDRAVRLWDVASGAPVAVLRGHLEGINALQFRADGQELISASQDGNVCVWDVPGRRLRTRLYGHADAVFGASYSRDGKKIVTAGADSTVRVWDAVSSGELLRFSGHASPVAYAAFTEDDRAVVSAGWDGTLKTWSASGHTGRVTDQAFSVDGRLVATGARDGAVRIWETNSGNELRAFEKDPAAVTVLTFSPDGGWLAAGRANGGIDILEPTTAKQAASLCCQSGSISGLAFGPDGTRLVSGATAGGVAVWNVPGRSLMRQILSAHPYETDKVAFSANGNWIAAATSEGKLWLWDAGDLTLLHSLPAHQHTVYRITFAPESATIATGGGDGLTKIWNVQSGKVQVELPQQHAPIMDAVFTPDGTGLITATLTGAVRVWNTATGEALPGPASHSANAALRLTKDGSRLATFSWDRSARVWDTKTWQELMTLTDRGPLNGGSISFDGSHLATFTPYDGIMIVPTDLAALEQLAKSRVHRKLTREECQRYLPTEDCRVQP